MRSEHTRPRAFRPVGREKKTSSGMMKKNLSELAARLRELKTAVTELQAKIMRDPRTKNVVGFAALAVLAAVMFSLAEPAPTAKVGGPTGGASWAGLKDKAWDGHLAQKELERRATEVKRSKEPEPLKWVTTARPIYAVRPGVEKPTRGENGRYPANPRNMITAGKGFNFPVFAEDGSTVTIQYRSQTGAGEPQNVTARFPKEAFVEYGGQPSDEGIFAIESWDWFPEVAPPAPTPTPAPKRVYQAGEPADDPQGRTPELLAALQKACWHPAWREYTSQENIDAISGLVGNPAPDCQRLKSIIAVFPALGEALAGGAAPELPKIGSKFSLRPEMEEWKVSVKGSREAVAARPDISCVTRSYQAALELLWSREEGRPVKLSAAFLRWAHDQQGRPGAANVWASVPSMAKGIQQYGVCEEKFMPESQKTPSQEALRDAAKRKNLVVRRVSISLREHPNQPERLDRYHPVMTLVDYELRQGRPILVFGALTLPLNLSNPFVLEYSSPVDPDGKQYYANYYGADRGWAANSRPPGMGHARLLVGYEAIARDITSPNRATDRAGTKGRVEIPEYLLEHRESSGTNMGDKGHIYTLECEDDLAEYWSLGLK